MDALTNLRFADDLLILGSTKRQIQIMLEELLVAVSAVGLEMHSGKTKILTNVESEWGKRMKVSNAVLDIVDEVAYLGRKLSFRDLHGAELQNRLDRAWKQFFRMKSELCGKHVSFKTKMRLFNAVVTPCFLYGAGTWTLTAARERQIIVAQRRML
eukprot:8351440-Karenia_brevis.AAC.1